MNRKYIYNTNLGRTKTISQLCKIAKYGKKIESTKTLIQDLNKNLHQYYENIFTIIFNINLDIFFRRFWSTIRQS